MSSSPLVPPFDETRARMKVQAAEDAHDPYRVAAAYTPDSRWRNRSAERDHSMPLR